MKKLMAGIDLHSNNLFCGIVDQDGQQVYLQKLSNDMSMILKALKPFKARLERVAVESTFNWYWLVDGLEDAGYDVALANPAQIEQYSGVKRTNDKSDALFLADLLRLGILPEGHICDRELRPVRDMLRRRLMLVRQRTALFLSLKSLYSRTTGQQLSLSDLKKMEASEAARWYRGAANQEIAQVQLQLVDSLTAAVAQLEGRALETARKCEGWEKLQTVPGIGRILGMTIMLETAGVERFPSAGDYASYCRCVDTERISNGKRKGRNNGKCGNKYLAWAYVEAAHGAARFCARARAFYDRKSAQRNGIVATKALACKLAKACWHILKEGTGFEEEKAFGAKKGKKTSLEKEEVGSVKDQAKQIAGRDSLALRAGLRSAAATLRRPSASESSVEQQAKKGQCRRSPQGAAGKPEGKKPNLEKSGLNRKRGLEKPIGLIGKTVSSR